MPAAANSAPLEALLASIRKRCKPGLWSQGVTLARAGAVTVESPAAEEIVLRVRAPGRVGGADRGPLPDRERVRSATARRG